MAREVESGGAMTELDLPDVPPVLENIDAVEPGINSDAQVEPDGLPQSPTTNSLPNEASEPAAVEHDALDDRLSSPEQPTSASARTPKYRAKPRAKTQRSDIPARPAVLDHRRNPSVQYGSEEELATLYAENRHLKRLMIVKLRAENDRLKSILRRFGGP